MHDDDVEAAMQEVFDSLTGATISHGEPDANVKWAQRIKEAGEQVREAGKKAAAEQLAESENCDWRTLKPLLREGERGKWLSGIEVVVQRGLREFWLTQRFNSRETAIEGAKLWMRLMRSTRMLPPVDALPVIIPSENDYREWCRTGENAGAVQKAVDILRAAGTWIDGANGIVPPFSVSFPFDGTKDPLPSLEPLRKDR